MNFVEWLLLGGAAKFLLTDQHRPTCQCNLCRAASVVCAWGLHRRGVLLGLVQGRG